MVPETCTTKVMKHARMVVRHFLQTSKLKGFSESEGDVQSMTWCSDLESVDNCCASCDADDPPGGVIGGFSLDSCEVRLVEDRGLAVGLTMAEMRTRVVTESRLMVCFGPGRSGWSDSYATATRGRNRSKKLLTISQYTSPALVSSVVF
jgi:hypothetical protein